MRQGGFALLSAMMIGALLVIIVAGSLAYLLGSGHFLSAGISHDVAYNTAQSGLASAIANFDPGDPAAVATTDAVYGNVPYSISVSNAPGQGYILTASSHPAQDPSQVRTIRSIIQPVDSLAQYAIAAGGDVTLANHTFVTSRPSSGLGNVRSNANIRLSVHSSTDGTLYAEGSTSVDAHSHAWAGAEDGVARMTLPTYTTAQILQFQAVAQASRSVEIPRTPLAGGPGGWGPRGLTGRSPAAAGSWGLGPGGWWVAGNLPATLSWGPLPAEQPAGACGGPNSLPAQQCGPALEGYYYSYPGYDPTTPTTNGLTLELRSGNYTLDGVMFVAGKLLIHDGTTITGEGKIIATEGISVRDHVGIFGATKLSHIDLVSLYGDIEVRHQSVLGQLNSGFVGRRGDVDTLRDLQDQNDPTGQYSAGDDGQGGSDDALDSSQRDSWLPPSEWLARATGRLNSWLLPPAYAEDAGGDTQAAGDDTSGVLPARPLPPGFQADGRGADQEHGDDWKSRYAASIPVGCTVWAQNGNVRFFEHSTLLGNIIAGQTVWMSNHCDLVRNSADPVQAAGLESWKASTYQTVR